MNIKEHKAKKIADRLANQLYIDVKAKRELKEDQITEVTQTLSNLTQTLNIAEAMDIDDMTPEEIKKQLEKLNRESLQGCGEKRIAAQHEKGKLTARERIDLLVDEGSFVEIDRFVKHRLK